MLLYLLLVTSNVSPSARACCLASSLVSGGFAAGLFAAACCPAFASCRAASASLPIATARGQAAEGDRQEKARLLPPVQVVH